MKVKVLTRNPDDYLRETKQDIHKGMRCSLKAVDHVDSEATHLLYFINYAFKNSSKEL